MNRRRQAAFLTGNIGGNTTNIPNVTNNQPGQSSLSSATQDYGRYPETYAGGINGSMYVGYPDYKNQNVLFHNNVADNVMDEQVFENRIFIDSSLRDYSKNNYKNPFEFEVKFNGTQPKTEMINVIVGDEIYSYVSYLSGDFSVVFDRSFENLKATIINSLFLPHAIDYKTMPDGSYEHIGKGLDRKHFRYILLKVKELKNDRSFSNNPAFDAETFIMKLDDDTCFNHHRWIAMSKNVSYPNSSLKNIDKLTVSICDDRGKVLFPTLDGKKHDFFGEYRNLIDQIIVLQKKGKVNEIELLKPKLNSLKHITSCLSPELHITLCILESQISTLPNFGQ